MRLAMQWKKVKKAGLAPQPRTSFGMVAHRGRAFLFGGVAEQAGKGDRIYSENFDELYQFSMDLKRWFPVSFRRPKQASRLLCCQSFKNSNPGDLASAWLVSGAKQMG